MAVEIGLPLLQKVPNRRSLAFKIGQFLRNPLNEPNSQKSDRPASKSVRGSADRPYFNETRQKLFTEKLRIIRHTFPLVKKTVDSINQPKNRNQQLPMSNFVLFLSARPKRDWNYTESPR
jgi:hypothetical protein